MTLVQKRQGVYEGDECLVCGRRPVDTINATSFWSFLILWGMRTIKGPMCHDHGVELTRQALRRTLMLGWWGIGLLVTPWALLWCWIRMRRAKRIPPSETPPAIDPATFPPAPTDSSPRLTKD